MNLNNKEKQAAKRESAFKTANEMAAKVKEDPQLFQQYLKVQSQFELYSVKNCLLILNKNPNAKYLKEATNWMEHGERPIYGSNITIIEPKKFTKDDKVITYYDVKEVYDISSVPGQIYKDSLLGLNKQQYTSLLTQISPVKIIADKDFQNGAIYDYENKNIKVGNIGDVEKVFASLSKEIAHAILHERQPDSDYLTNNFNAYCTSYMLCNRLGFNTESFNFSQVPSLFENADIEEILNQLTPMKKTIESCLNRMGAAIWKQKDKIRRENER